MEGPGKGELVHLGGKQWEVEVSTWGRGEQGLCEFLVSGFLVLLPQLGDC